MKGKAVITDGAPEEIIQAMGSKRFARSFLRDIIGKTLGAENVLERPAEYYLQKPDLVTNANDEFYGIEFRLTGASRDGRTPAQFHKAIKDLHDLINTTVINALKLTKSNQGIQTFVVIMLDADIETNPGSGVYSNVIESEAKWINS